MRAYLVLKGYPRKQERVFRNSSESEGKQCGAAINGVNCSSNGVIESTTGRNWNETAFARNAGKHALSMHSRMHP